MYSKKEIIRSIDAQIAKLEQAKRLLMDEDDSFTRVRAPISPTGKAVIAKAAKLRHLIARKDADPAKVAQLRKELEQAKAIAREAKAARKR